MMRHTRLHLWLLAMDAIAFCGGFGSRLYGYCVERASDATDWGNDADCSNETGEVPF